MTRLDDFSTFPFHIDDFKTASCLQSFHLAFRFPGIGQGWQKVHRSVMTLANHLGYSRGATEVAVNLEWRMRVEEIAVGTSLLLYFTIADHLVVGERQLIAYEPCKRGCRPTAEPKDRPSSPLTIPCSSRHGE